MKLEKTSTANMSREQWQSYRKKEKRCGGSDAGTILGLNPYKSPYALWAEKTGAVEPEDLSDKEAVRLGNDLEAYVADRWEEKTGKKVRRERNILYNPAYPFAHANIDRAVVGEPDAGLECKTTSNPDVIRQVEDGKIPDVWYCQMVHYLMVTGRKKWYLACLCFGKGFYEFTIERDEAEIAALARAEQEFYAKVMSNTPPSVDGSDSTIKAIGKLFPNSNGVSIDIGGCREHLTAYAAIKRQIAELEKQMQEQQAAIETYMGVNEKGTCDGFAVSWKTQERSTFDKARWEAEHGKIPAEYFKKSSSRPFKVTVKQ